MFFYFLSGFILHKRIRYWIHKKYHTLNGLRAERGSPLEVSPYLHYKYAPAPHLKRIRTPIATSEIVKGATSEESDNRDKESERLLRRRHNIEMNDIQHGEGITLSFGFQLMKR